MEGRRKAFHASRNHWAAMIDASCVVGRSPLACQVEWSVHRHVTVTRALPLASSCGLTSKKWGAGSTLAVMQCLTRLAKSHEGNFIFGFGVSAHLATCVEQPAAVWSGQSTIYPQLDFSISGSSCCPSHSGAQ